MARREGLEVFRGEVKVLGYVVEEEVMVFEGGRGREGILKIEIRI